MAVEPVKIDCKTFVYVFITLTPTCKLNDFIKWCKDIQVQVSRKYIWLALELEWSNLQLQFTVDWKKFKQIGTYLLVSEAFFLLN